MACSSVAHSSACVFTRALPRAACIASAIRTRVLPQPDNIMNIDTNVLASAAADAGPHCSFLAQGVSCKHFCITLKFTAPIAARASTGLSKVQMWVLWHLPYLPSCNNAPLLSKRLHFVCPGAFIAKICRCWGHVPWHCPRANFMITSNS